MKLDLTKKEIEALMARRITLPYLTAVQKLLQAHSVGRPAKPAKTKRLP
jgi:hypothetical protein